MTRELQREELQASRRLMQVAEWELQQILLDIHDGPVQHMYAALSQLDLLRRALDANTPVPAEVDLRVDRIRSLLEHGLSAIRTYLGAYRTPQFESRPLPALLEALVVQHESLTDTRVQLQVEEPLPDPPLTVKIAIYRVLQEAFSNAYRHGGASEVTVHLSATPEKICVTVQDNGAGFNLSELPPGHHFGLEGMRDRVQMIGGTFNIETKPQSGTTVIVEVPAT